MSDVPEETMKLIVELIRKACESVIMGEVPPVALLKAVLGVQGAHLDVDTGRMTHIVTGCHLGDVNLDSVARTEEGLEYTFAVPTPIRYIKLDIALTRECDAAGAKVDDEGCIQLYFKETSSVSITVPETPPSEEAS